MIKIHFKLFMLFEQGKMFLYLKFCPYRKSKHKYQVEGLLITLYMHSSAKFTSVHGDVYIVGYMIRDLSCYFFFLNHGIVWNMGNVSFDHARNVPLWSI